MPDVATVADELLPRGYGRQRALPKRSPTAIAPAGALLVDSQQVSPSRAERTFRTHRCGTRTSKIRAVTVQVRWHDMRHICCTRLVEARVLLQVMASILGLSLPAAAWSRAADPRSAATRTSARSARAPRSWSTKDIG